LSTTSASTRFCRRSGCGATANAARSGKAEWRGHRRGSVGGVGAVWRQKRRAAARWSGAAFDAVKPR
jgi:hypothetical protein